MSEHFHRRLAGARDRAVAQKERAEKQAAAERQTEPNSTQVRWQRGQ